MKAARFHAKEDVRVEDVEEPEPGPGEVKLRNAYSGICGSDLHVYYAPEAAGLDFTNPHPVTGAMPPQILGHEFAGTVVAVGDGVDRLAEDDRVAVWPVYYCGECAACLAGRYNVCRQIGFHGLNSHGGGMAEFTTVAADKCHKLPESVDLRMGALVEPMAVSWHAVDLGGAEAGKTALVAGAGPIGIGCWFALRARGIDTVIVSEPSAVRREAIEGLGARHVIDPASDDLDAAVADLTNGHGVDCAFEAAGVGVALTSALANLRPGGRAVVVALHERGFDFNPTTLVMSETTVTGALAYLQADYDAVIDAMAAGKYSAEGWVTERPVDEVVAAFGELRSGERIKVLVHT